MTPFDLLKIILGTWYIAHAVTATHGPAGIFEWTRDHVWHGRRGMRLEKVVIEDGAIVPALQVPKENGLLDCIVCFAPWVALVLLIAPDGMIVNALAIAGGALLLHSFTGWRFGD